VTTRPLPTDDAARQSANARVLQAATGKDAQDHIAADHGLADFQVDEFPADDDDPYQEQAESDYAAIFDFDVEREAHKIRVREAAREIVEASKRPPAEPFDAGTLAEILARPPEPAARVEGLIPWEAGTELVAQRKTGKTTLLLNLARSLFTGEEFLGKFGVRPIDGEIAFLNFEVSGAQLARWATDVGISPDQFYIVNLRGRRNPFSNTETGNAFGLDQFARAEVGARDVVLSAHAGWNGERTRGASALEDWADSIITMTKTTAKTAPANGTSAPSAETSP
jgi:hypothetical protein